MICNGEEGIREKSQESWENKRKREFLLARDESSTRDGKSLSKWPSITLLWDE